MSPEQAQALADQLKEAARDDNDTAGQAAALDLLAGMAVNLAVIAKALTS